VQAGGADLDAVVADARDALDGFLEAVETTPEDNVSQCRPESHVSFILRAVGGLAPA
jgi:hypothetical protein